MSFQVEITPLAESDMDEAYLWWAQNRSPEQAGRWYREILRVLDTISEMPERFSLCDEPELKEEELRQMLFGLGGSTTHRIVFEVVGQTVRVLRVRHTGRTS